MSRTFIPLEDVRVASPCHADWNMMDGNERVKLCGSCQKNVYNLSEMTRFDAEELLAQHEGNLCVRYYQRADGTIMTQDCPVGLVKVRRAVLMPLGWAAAGVAAIAAWVALSPRATMGEPMVTTGITAPAPPVTASSHLPYSVPAKPAPRPLAPRATAPSRSSIASLGITMGEPIALPAQRSSLVQSSSSEATRRLTSILRKRAALQRLLVWRKALNAARTKASARK